jgi:hypothetical protein
MVKFDLPRGYSLILIGFDNGAASAQSWRIEDDSQVCHNGGDLSSELPGIIADICRGQAPWGKPVFDDQSTDNFIMRFIALVMIKVVNYKEHFKSLKCEEITNVLVELRKELA